VQVGQVAVTLVHVEAVPDEELVRHGEADVANRQVLDQAAVRPVEQRHCGQRAGRAQAEGAYEVVQGQAGVDDVLHDHDVPVLDARVEVLQEPDGRGAAGLVGRVAGELDEVDLVDDRDRAREVGEKDEARLQGRDEDRLCILVVGGDLGSQLADPGRDLLRREVDLADALVMREGRAQVRQEASFRPYRCPRRSMSRL
jgi:hypothetical protein